MAVSDIDIPIAAVAASISEHACGDSSAVCLEGQNHHVTHQTQVFTVITWSVRWAFELDVKIGLVFLGGSFDALLDLPYTVKEFVQLAFVLRCHLFLQTFRVLGDKVENASLHQFTLFSPLVTLLATAFAEHPFEDGPWIRFFADRS